MANHSLAFLPLLDAGREVNETKNWTGFPVNQSSEDYLNNGDIEDIIFSIFFSVISIFGFVGNGVVIWSLACHLKRNSFTIFIFNLSVADFGVLLSLVIIFLDYLFHFHPSEGIIFFYFFMYITGQMLLTAISIDRCVSVLFPIWHRCHRPSYLSSTVCIIIWIMSFLIFTIPYTIAITFQDIYDALLIIPFLVTTFLCLPFMIISGLILSIKACPKLQQHKRMRLLLTILLTLFFFLIFGFPLNAAMLFEAFIADSRISLRFVQYSISCSALNSSVNPLIYFLAGKKKRSQTRESITINLRRVFKDNKDSGREFPT